MDHRIEQKESGGKGMFFMEEDGKLLGHLKYTIEDNGIMTIDHTEVDSSMSGKGLASDLVKHSVEFARENNLKVNPLCSYAAKQFQRNEAYRELLVNNR